MTDQVDDQKLRGLMAAYQDGAYDAFEDLYGALNGPVRGWLMSQTRDRCRAEDLAQETFLQVHRARRTYDRGYPVMPWVMAIARHVYLMERRRASRRPTYVDEQHAPDAAVQPDAERHLGGAPVRRALGRVSPERRSALLLHHLAGWSFRDIASKLGIRESAAKLRSSRGAAQLRDALKDEKDHS